MGRGLRRLSRGEWRCVAECLRVSTRTLRNWKTATPGGEITLGRPPLDDRRQGMVAVLAELERQGWPGYRQIAAALPGLRTRLVQ